MVDLRIDNFALFGLLCFSLVGDFRIKEDLWLMGWFSGDVKG